MTIQQTVGARSEIQSLHPQLLGHCEGSTNTTLI